MVAQFVANDSNLSIDLALCEGVYYLDATLNDMKHRAKVVVLGH